MAQPSVHALLSRVRQLEASAFKKAVAQRKGPNAAARKARARYEMENLLAVAIQRSNHKTIPVWQAALRNLDTIYS